MAHVCPAILASYPEEYEREIQRVSSFATRLHIDVADGNFTPNVSVGPTDIWWPGGIRADLHVMHRRPIEIIDQLIALAPQMIILHAEAEGDFLNIARQLHFHGIEAGIALLPDTPAELIRPGLDVIDHVLIFSGDLGHYGGKANLALLDKVKTVRHMSNRIEIGWDGGVSPENIRLLRDGGVEVLISGGYIQKATDPTAAYETLVERLE